MSKENLGYYTLEFNKPCFDDEYSKLIHQRNQANLNGWNSSQMNGNNLQHLRRGTSGIFWNNKSEYLKVRINELEINNKKYVGVNIQRYK